MYKGQFFLLCKSVELKINSICRQTNLFIDACHMTTDHYKHEGHTVFPGRAQVQMRPSWQAVMMQSSMKTRTVSLSCAIFLHTSGSSSGTSFMRGHSVVPRTLAASRRLLRGATLILSLLLLMLPRLWYLLCSFSTPLLPPDLSDLRSWSDSVAKRPILNGVLFPVPLLPPPPPLPPPSVVP